MEEALSLAQQAGQTGAIPVGALLVNANGEIVVRSKNDTQMPTHHAEMLAIDEYFTLKGNASLKKAEPGLTLITTLEPCIMCAGAILGAHIDRVVFGAWDPKFGASGSVWDILRDPRSPYRPEVFAGVLEEKCSEILSKFFTDLR